MKECGEALGYAPDLVVVLKVMGDRLLVYRTGGADYPEVAEFTRQLQAAGPLSRTGGAAGRYF